MCETLLLLFIDEKFETRVRIYFAISHMVNQCIAAPRTHSVSSKICAFYHQIE